MLKLSEAIRKKSRGKKIVVVGVGTFCKLNMRFLIELGLDIGFFVDKDYSKHKYFEHQTGFKVMPYDFLNRAEHFPFVFQYNYQVIDSIISDLHSKGFEKQDYIVLPDAADEDLLYRGMVIGKASSSYDVLMDWPIYVKYVGRYSSINHTAQVVFDHNKTYLTTVNMRYTPIPVRERLSIGHDVWMGANVVINASKVKSIGNGAIIGSGAVVVEDVPPYAVVAGVPAKVKKYRFTPKQIDILERVQWWNWDEETIRLNGDCFTNIDLFFERFGS